MNLSRKFLVLNAVAACYPLAVVLVYFALRAMIARLHAEGFLAMCFGMVYSFGTPIFFDLVPVVGGVAGAAGVVAECRRRHLASSRTWLAGIGAALGYFGFGCLLVYLFFEYAA